MIGKLRRLSHYARWRYLRWVVAAPVVPLVLWACNAHPLETPVPIPEQQNDQYYEVNPVREVDILFLVDNSPSMREEQQNLTRNFPVFMNELKKIEGGLPNVHVAVVSSDLGAGPTPLMGGCLRPGGDRGIFQTGNNCGLAANARFISSENNATVNNYAAGKDISEVFSCMANLGVAGCGFEHQLQASRVALYESITPENATFLRENAYLAIIIITDEDDCSADIQSTLFTDDDPYRGTEPSFRCAKVGHQCNGTENPTLDTFSAPLGSCKPSNDGKLIPIEMIVNSIRAVKKRPDQQILVSGIFGWPTNETGALYRFFRNPAANIDLAPICESANGSAAPGIRMKSFVDSFGESGQTFSICQDDFSPAMQQIGQKLAAKLGNPCITAPLVDIKADTGVQADCEVVDQVPQDSGGFKNQLVVPCGSGAIPCWKLTAANECSISGYKIEVDRGGAMATPGTQQSIKCRTCNKPDDPRCAR